MGAIAAISAVTALTSYEQAQGQRSAGSAQRAMFEANARIADLQAQDAVLRGQEAARQKLVQTRGLIGSQRATLAAQGIDVESGTALDLQVETAGLGALDALTIRNNAAREAWGYRVQASDLESKGVFSSLAASNAAGSTLATGGLQIARDYMVFGERGSKTPKTKGEGG